MGKAGKTKALSHTLAAAYMLINGALYMRVSLLLPTLLCSDAAAIDEDLNPGNIALLSLLTILNLALAAVSWRSYQKHIATLLNSDNKLCETNTLSAMCSKDGAWALARYTGAGVKTLAGGASFYSFARLLLPHPAITGVVTLVLSIGNFMAQTAVLQDSKSAKTSENTTPLLAAATADKLTEELEEPRRTA